MSSCEMETMVTLGPLPWRDNGLAQRLIFCNHPLSRVSEQSSAIMSFMDGWSYSGSIGSLSNYNFLPLKAGKSQEEDEVKQSGISGSENAKNPSDN